MVVVFCCCFFVFVFLGEMGGGGAWEGEEKEGKR